MAVRGEDLADRGAETAAVFVRVAVIVVVIVTVVMVVTVAVVVRRRPPRSRVSPPPS